MGRSQLIAAAAVALAAFALLESGAAARPRAHRATILIAAPDLDDESAGDTRVLVPLVCADDHGGLRSGADCTRAKATGQVLLQGGAREPATRRPDTPSCFAAGEPVASVTALVIRDRVPRGTLASWPAPADGGLRVAPLARASTPTEDGIAGRGKVVTEAFDVDLDGDGRDEHVLAIRSAGHRHPIGGVEIVIVDGRDPRRVTRPPGPTEASESALVLGTSDVDGDGARELIVMFPALNDYGVAVWEYGTDAAVYRFDCGNA